jgi:hypothetical protein
MQRYPFFGLLAFAVDLTGLLDPTSVLPFSALAAAAIRLSVLSVSAAQRAACVALRWLARRFISLASFLLSICSSPEDELLGHFGWDTVS